MRPSAQREERGQVLVIVAMGMVALVAMVGLVIDGGYAWSRQRDNQNGADAVAKAGAGVVQHFLAGVDSPTPNDYDVACAVEAAADANGVVLEDAEYVDYKGDPLLPTAVLVGTCTTDLGVVHPDRRPGRPGAYVPDVRDVLDGRHRPGHAHQRGGRDRRRR